MGLVKSAGVVRSYVCPLPNLRIGSQLVTRRGVTYKVLDAMVVVASNGGESPSLVVERLRDGRNAELFLTVGILANMARGAMHRPGDGERIDWTEVRRKSQLEASHALEAQQPPTLRRRRIRYNAP
jgi:hypothetical protein